MLRICRQFTFETKSTGTYRQLLKEWRRAWTEKVNEKFWECHMAARIDHRSYKEQGIDLIRRSMKGMKSGQWRKRELKQ